MATALAQRRRVVREDDIRDQRAGDFLGRLYLNEQITLAELEAGELFGRTAIQARWGRGAPKPHPSGMTLDGTGSGTIINFLEEADEIRVHRRAVEEFEEARKGLLKCVGAYAYSATIQVCAYGWEPTEIATLKVGLRYLVTHFKIPTDLKEDRKKPSDTKPPG